MADTYALLAACCRPSGPEATAAIRADAARSDWAQVIASADVHGMVPLMCRRVVDAAADLLDADARAQLNAAALSSSASALAGAQQLGQVVAGLERAGIAVLPYKGPALAVDAFGAVALRDPHDLDVIVAPVDRSRAMRELGAMGYHPVGATTWSDACAIHDWQGHVPSVGAGQGRGVELHWRFCDRKLPWSAPVDEVMARATWTEIAGVRMRIPERHDQLLLVLLHAARHGWDRLEAMACAAALVAQGIDGEVLLDRARTVGGTRATLCGLDLMRRATGVALPALVSAALAADDSLGPLADQGEARLRRGDAGDARDAALHFALLDSLAHRARYVALHVALPTPQDRAVVHLPRALAALYLPVRMARLAARALTRPGVSERAGASR